MLVLPVPGGPHKMMEDNRPLATMRSSWSSASSSQSVAWKMISTPWRSFAANAMCFL